MTNNSLNKRFRSLLILGPPGSGKGTLGKFLKAAGNHFHLSSGDIFRGLDPESETGQLYYSYASKGFLVPDSVTVEVWKKYVDGLMTTNRYFPSKQLLLLDGIPRTLSQALILDQYIDVVKVLVLDMPNIEGLVQRMKRRALIEKRLDDTDEEVLTTRMKVFNEQTLELLTHYDPSIVHHVNADQKPLEVLRDVLNEFSHVLS